MLRSLISHIWRLMTFSHDGRGLPHSSLAVLLTYAIPFQVVIDPTWKGPDLYWLFFVIVGAVALPLRRPYGAAVALCYIGSMTAALFGHYVLQSWEAAVLAKAWGVLAATWFLYGRLAAKQNKGR